MPNHFHLLIYQKANQAAITQFMRSLITAYSMYFNRRYIRVGPVFQGRFKASFISRDDYLQHISRYIHLNPAGYKLYEWSSLLYYTGSKQASWLTTYRILELFTGKEEYVNFVSDYEENKKMLEEIRSELADRQYLV